MLQMPPVRGRRSPTRPHDASPTGVLSRHDRHGGIVASMPQSRLLKVRKRRRKVGHPGNSRHASHHAAVIPSRMGAVILANPAQPESPVTWHD